MFLPAFGGASDVLVLHEQDEKIRLCHTKIASLAFLALSTFKIRIITLMSELFREVFSCLRERFEGKDDVELIGA